MNSQLPRMPRRFIMVLGGTLLAGAAVLGCGKTEGPVADEAASGAADVELGQPSGAAGSAAVDASAGGGGGGVAIQVGDQVVTREEFDRELRQETEQMGQRLLAMGQPPEMVKQYVAQSRDGMARELADRRVSKMLLDDCLTQAAVEVGAEELEQEWTKFAGQFPDQATLERMLQAEGMTVAEIKAELELFTKLKKRLGDTEATDEETQAFYDSHPEDYSQPAQVRARHILLNEKEGAKEAVEALHKRIVAGEDFAALASEHSDCPSGQQGGDLGFFSKGRMVPEFAEAAFALKTGEVSAPVQTEFGYHIIKVEDRHDAKKLEFGEVQEDIKKKLGNEKFETKLSELIEQLKKTTKVTIDIGLPVEQPAVLPEGAPDPNAGAAPDAGAGAAPDAGAEVAP
ncbi:MAG: peptidylprolyl isomerase [Patescibacteria group bacterium]|nr:peptidylprolyl isomerase [Patescibacteria group bacterium]